MSDAAPDRAPDPAPELQQDHQHDRPLGEPSDTRRGRHARRTWSVADTDAEAAEAVEAGEPTFPHKPLLRTGYDRHAVDEFVTKVALAVHSERQTSVSADDVAGSRFPGRRLGPGYRMREVDDYLGAVEALLRSRAAVHGTDAATSTEAAVRHHREHHPTWWIYGIALLLIVVIVVFTVTQN